MGINISELARDLAEICATAMLGHFLDLGLVSMALGQNYRDSSLWSELRPILDHRDSSLWSELRPILDDKSRYFEILEDNLEILKNTRISAVF